MQMPKMSKLPKMTKIKGFYRFTQKRSADFLGDFTEISFLAVRSNAFIYNSKMERSDSTILGNL